MKLRPYQEDAVQSVYDYFSTKSGNPILALPTGTGKSFILAEFLRRTFSAWPSQRVLVLTHVKELIGQNHAELIEHWPTAPAGIYSAGLKRRDLTNPITFCGIASVASKAEFFGHIDLVLVDECHLISHKADTMYQRFLLDLTSINPHLKVIGLSATPYRLGLGHLMEGGLFSDVCFDRTDLDNFNKLVQDGWLAPLITKRTYQGLDVSGVAVRGGEYVANELQAAVDIATVTDAAVREMIYYGADRKHWLVFATGIEHATHVAACLDYYGIPAKAVHSECSDEERDGMITDFKAGKLRCLVNNNILTTGFNFPGIDMIGFLRPTKSAVLWIQALGRGTRPCEGKENCIAEGQRVLTHLGLVPIERVTLRHKIWDGCQYVSHDGIIFRGKQKVITYENLVATPDHRVWTQEGWKTFGECSREQTPIAITGNAGKALREVEGYFTGGISGRERKQSATKSTLSILFERILQRPIKSTIRNRWVPRMRKPALGSEMAGQSGDIGKTAVYESKRPSLSTIWGTRNSLSFWISNGNGGLGSNAFRPFSPFGIGSDRQQRPLRDGESSLFYSFSKSGAYEKIQQYFKSSLDALKSPRNKIRRFYFSASILTRVFSRGNNRSLPKTVDETERGVWDILNAGPLHRFTVEGLLVSNCLVLDFAGNTRRLGPINDPVLPTRKGEGGGGGLAPVRVCEACNSYNHAAARLCAVCGAEFPRDHKLSGTAYNEEVMATSEPQIETFKVDSVNYQIHEKPGKPPSLRVSYFCGLRRFQEWVCFEHFGYAKTKAQDWWRERSDEKFPETTQQAAALADKLPVPVSINVWLNTKYPEIMSHAF